nr:MFS transporter [Kutzneria albida]
MLSLLSIDSYQRIGDEVGAPSHGNITVPLLLGLAAGQLAFGPVSDTVGRRGPLLVGSVAFVAAGVLAAFSPTIGILLAARLVQGLSAAAGMVVGRAIIADPETGRAAAHAFSLMMIVSGIAPVVAPSPVRRRGPDRSPDRREHCAATTRPAHH